MERVDIPKYPFVALCEALANALCHRDYSIGGGSAGVAIYADRLEITSAGPLHFGLTPQALYLPHESKPWNPTIANVLYRRGIIETWGRGTLKILEIVANAGMPRPEINESAGTVTITFFPIPTSHPTPQVTPQVTMQVTMQVARQVARMLAIASNPATREDLQNSFGLKDREHFRKTYLEPLVSSGWLERTIPDKLTSRLQRYRITEKGRTWLKKSG